MVVVVYLSKVRRTGGQDDPVSIDGLSPGLATGQGAVHEALVVEEIFETGAEAGLVVVPFQAVLLRLTHSD